jgi:hypothetical protein
LQTSVVQALLSLQSAAEVQPACGTHAPLTQVPPGHAPPSFVAMKPHWPLRQMAVSQTLVEGGQSATVVQAPVELVAWQ